MSRKQEEPAKRATNPNNKLGMREGDDEKNNVRIPKGYYFPPFGKPLLRILCQTSLAVSGVVIASDWLWLTVCMVVGFFTATDFGWVWAVPVHLLVLWPLCARALRGFENLTHEGSHHNVERKDKALNDRFVNLGCSFWVLISVEAFRATHEIHHKHFGSDYDPDKKRFGRLGVDDMPRQSLVRMLLYLLHTLPAYVVDYWKQFSGKSEQLKKSLALHALLMGLVSHAVYENFWLLWLLYFWLPFLLYLPVVRFLAEAEEHRYKDAETEFGSTFSNLSRLQRWLLHPHGDAYHLLHHMLPQVPHWKMAYAHWILSTLDRTFQGGQSRKSVFDIPQRYFGTVARYSAPAKGVAK